MLLDAAMIGVQCSRSLSQLILINSEVQTSRIRYSCYYVLKTHNPDAINLIASGLCVLSSIFE